jgi:putative nucleotidyltransferase with HDIG domain
MKNKSLRTKRSPALRRRCPSPGLDDLRASLAALRKFVLLENTKARLLRGKSFGPSELDALLADYLTVIQRLTGTTAGSILLRDHDGLTFRAARGPKAKGLIGRRMPLDEGIAGLVATTGKAYLCRNVSKDRRWSPRIGDDLKTATRNILAVPLLANDGVIGVVEVLNKRDGLPFGAPDRAMLEMLAGQLALDISYAGLLAESQREAGRRVTQMQLATVLNSTLDQREVRKRAIEAATNLMDAEVGSLLLVDKDSGDLFFEVALGEKGERLKQIRLKMGEGVAGWVAQHDESALVNDVANDPRHFKKAGAITQFVTRNMVCVPVRSKGRVIGVLQAINKKDEGVFSEEDLENFETLSNQVAIALDNAHLYEELKETFLNTAEALAAAVEKKDPYTGGHIRRVHDYSIAIARYLTDGPADLESIRLAAVLHDIGKIGIRDNVLFKQGGLTDEELALMRSHPAIGADILSRIEQMKEVGRILRAHHEKWDGSGYPEGLKGDRIPLAARIISVADALDAITTDRPYRKAADLATALAEIKRHAGSEFDPAVVDAFLKACETGDIIVGVVPTARHASGTG